LPKFTPVVDKPWLHYSANCDFWAKACYFASNRTQLQALVSFFTEQVPSYYCHSHCNNPIIERLYKLA
ncbi:hypothetical protein DM01DRAFT_248684, partial [Hesseltinella vesiculosa]